MKRFFAVLAYIALCSVAVNAQQKYSSKELERNPTDSRASLEVERVQNATKTEWLAPFSKVEINGPMQLVFKQVNTDEELKIIYDNKGNLSSRFKAYINKNGTLQISERLDAQTSVQTTVTVYYRTLDFIKIAHSSAVIESPINTTMLDMTLQNGASLTTEINTTDVAIECTGRSTLNIKGVTRYLKLNTTTSFINGFELISTAAHITASHSAEVKITVAERLESIMSTSAKLLYKGHPKIIRNQNSLFGGDVIEVN